MATNLTSALKRHLIFTSFFSIILLLIFNSCSNAVQPVNTPVVHHTRMDIYVGSRNNSSVKKYDSTGNYLGDFISSGSGGLNTTQDILFLSDSVLLVTGLNNTA